MYEPIMDRLPRVMKAAMSLLEIAQQEGIPISECEFRLRGSDWFWSLFDQELAAHPAARGHLPKLLGVPLLQVRHQALEHEAFELELHHCQRARSATCRDLGITGNTDVDISKFN